MRMRKLGNGQSVMFFAPPEVDERIRQSASKTQEEKVEVLDILLWAMVETCTDIQHHAPMWAEQGYDHARRSDAWHQIDANHTDSGELKAAWLQPEARSLAELYGDELISPQSSRSDHAAQSPKGSIEAIDQRCEVLGVDRPSSMGMEEEQEREVDHEVEEERQIQRPPRADAAKHFIDPDIEQFVLTGRIPNYSSHFAPAFSTIVGAPSPLAEYQAGFPKLLATKDFSSTVLGDHRGHGDYLRPVNWILSSEATNPEVLILLSPYEVNHLLPTIRASDKVHLHMYTPRVTHAMRSLEDLRFYCIPPLPPSWSPPQSQTVEQLNLWAGQLYIRDHLTYERLSRFLGLSTQEIQCQREMETQPDGFIKPEHRAHSLISQCTFTESPVTFLNNLIAYRRKGMGYSLTHMGKILAARRLTEDDFSI